MQETIINDDFDFFLFDDEKYENTQKMTCDEFVSKTQSLLCKIERIYYGSFEKKAISEKEYEQSNCDNCQGQCTIKLGFTEYDCYPDNENGECFIRELNNELLEESMTDLILSDEHFYELMGAEIIKNN